MLIPTQIKTNEALGEFINQLTFKFNVMASYQKAMDSNRPNSPVGQLIIPTSRTSTGLT